MNGLDADQARQLWRWLFEEKGWYRQRATLEENRAIARWNAARR